VRQVKLRVANAVHTAMVYVMALSGLAVTARLGELPGLQTYLSQLFELDILPSLVRDGVGKPEARRFFTEWMGRLELPLDHSTFFVSQNAVAKVTERLVPTIASNGGKGSSSSAPPS
jgi:mannitol-1-phosphate/altronate dehydrogenase